MKKFLALILVISISIGCFVACEDDASESGAENAENSISTATATDEATAKPENEDSLLKDEMAEQGNYADSIVVDKQESGGADVVPSPTNSPVTSSDPNKDFNYSTEETLETLDVWTTPTATPAPTKYPVPTATAAPVSTYTPVITSTMRPGYTNTPMPTGTPFSTPYQPSINTTYTLPDNSSIDCLAMDFRRGLDSLLRYEDGFAYIQTGENSANDCFLDATDLSDKPASMKVYIEGSDPYFYLYSNVATGNKIDLNLQEYPFLKVVMKNNTSSSKFELYTFEQGSNCTDAGRITVSGISTNDTSFKTYYIDLRANGASNTLSVSKGSQSLDRHFSALRFDVPGSSGTVEIQYIGFFKTMADAQAYR